MNNKFLYIIDGTALLFRSYHATANYFLNSKYYDTSALAGSVKSALSYMLRAYPTNVVIVFDVKGGSFRNEIYKEYKQNRSRPDELLLWQLDKAPEVFKALGFPVYTLPGYEADDVIGTLAKYHSQQGVEVLIESKDKDFVQLIDKNISLADSKNESLYDFKNGHLKFGVPIEYTIDYLALCGDSVDNIPGVAGVGEKSSVALINTFGGIADIYRAIDEKKFDGPIGSFKPATLAKKLIANRENAFLSYTLATINTQAPVKNMELEHLTLAPANVNKVLDLFEEIELFSLRNSFMKQTLNGLIYTPEHDELVEAYKQEHELKENKSTLRISKFDVKNLTREQAKEIEATGLLPDGSPLGSGAAKAKARKAAKAEQVALAAQAAKEALENASKEIASDDQDNDSASTSSKETTSKSTSKASKAKKDSESKNKATVVVTEEDIALLATTQAFPGRFSQYQDLVKEYALLETHKLDLPPQDFSTEEIYLEQFTNYLATSPAKQALEEAKQVSLLLEKNPLHNTPVVLHLLVESGEPQEVTSDNGKPEYTERKLFSLPFAQAEIFLTKVKHDEFITPAYTAFTKAFANEILRPLLSNKEMPIFTSDLKDLAHEFNLTLDEVNQVGSNVHDLRVVGYTRNSAIKNSTLISLADHFCNLYIAPIKYLKTKLDLEAVYSSTRQETLFMPLFARLTKDTQASTLYKEMEQPLWKYLYAMEVNGILVNSQILEEIKVDLEEQIEQAQEQIFQTSGAVFNPNSPKQTAEILYGELLLEDPSGKGSTAAEVLMQLKHPVIEHILNYRSLTTILGSHVVPLLEIARASADSKVHTTFLQTSTVTGRLSSQEPNLQNVPAVADIAKRIRASFIAPAGYKMVSLDYSQIELRVSASLSQDEHMIEGFNHGEDIHARTASKLFDVPVDQVQKSQRQIAKAINFGLNYGKTSFSLATELGISRQEASSYIKEYFATYPKIKDFIDQTIEQAKARGFVQTVKGRIIPLNNFNSPIRAVVDSEKRNATNYPIQSSAAEVIKTAMIAIQKELTSSMPEVIPHLQVHDELVFSIPEHLVDTYVAKIKEVMETSVQLPQVILKVEASIADHWTK
ncbi:hypothetical protein CKF54_01195 [Psittacicella hinzii]|uniref:DNA polymerase I n=1 Tax=Psittacicella hinzii TaxID=2028575 RepID=A0A3A1YDG9_9GAMM|nr:DNA polymerase [Psittacicella hinzii]RIY34234.1 hypothetical protein CKF54_01195 [Psittacicella hinzii]